jgi:hypothetical protein
MDGHHSGNRGGTLCSQEFKVPMSALKRIVDSQARLQGQFGAHKCEGEARFGLDSEKKEAPYLTMDANRIRKGHTMPLMSSEDRGTHYH